MKPRKEYTVTKLPSSDWNNVTETLSLDGSSGNISREIRNEIWNAFKNMEDFSYPWVVVVVENGNPKAHIFRDEETAQKYKTKTKKNLLDSTQTLCIKADYR
jgi:mitochondrial fission protein ELM1